MRIQTETAVGLFVLVATGIFLYMSYQVGSFRFDRIRYTTYYAYFADISGLSKKSDIKIAGVKVGWVDAVDLVNDGQQVKATLLIDKKYVLSINATAVVRQEGLLGSKYLEITPGDPLLAHLEAGGMLTMPSHGPVQVDELLHQFKNVAGNVESITASLKGAIGGTEGEEKVRALVDGLKAAAEKLASFSGSIDRVVTRNEGTIDGIVNDLHAVLVDLKSEIPKLSQTLQQNFDQISRNFERVTAQIEQVGHPAQEVVQKINEGRGILGQLVNDDEAYRDIRIAVNGVKKYFDKIDKTGVVFDVHTESMMGPFDGYCDLKESKGYFAARIHPCEDYFYLAGLVATKAGRMDRYELNRAWYKDYCRQEQLVPGFMDLAPDKQLKYAPVQQRVWRKFDQFLFNLQFGKVFGNIAFRAGLFDSSGGVGVDVDLPFGTESFRWVTTLELFDLNGRNRRADDRPHLKWLNRLFFTRNIYCTFGADDFVSRCNKNAFFGIGLRFADDDVKYYASKIGK